MRVSFLSLGSVLAVTISAAPGFAQTTVTIREVNPTRSTLDATNPNGASGGRVNGLGSTRIGRTYYAATEWGGLYKSTDSGRVWRRLDSHVPVATWDVEVDPSDSAKVYATSWYDGRVNSQAGINVSSDGGRSWVHPATAVPPINFCAVAARRDEPSAFGIAIDPADSRNVYVGTNCGLAVSRNSGLTWRYIDPTSADGADDVWDVIVHDGGIIDLCGDDGHQRSIDGGTTWTTATGAGLPAGQCTLAVSPDEPYVLLANWTTQVLESDDGGATWPTTLTNPEPNPQGRTPFVAINQRAGTAFDLWYGDVRLFRAGCTTPAAPVSGGNARCPLNTWTVTSAGAHSDVGDLAFDRSDASDACPTLFSSDGGVYFNTLTVSPGCQTPTWEQPDTTPRALWLFGMGGAHQPGTAVEDLYHGDQDDGTEATTNAPATPPTWSNRDCCDGFDVSADPARVLYTVCCWFPGRVNRLFMRSSGMTGGGEINTYPAGNLQGFRPPDIIDQFGSDDYVLVTTSGVFITQSITASPIVWTQLGAGPVNARAVKAAVSGGTPTFVVQAGQANGRNIDQLWTYTGTATGGAWTQVNRPGNQGGFGIFDVDPNNPNRIIASHLRPGFNPAMVLTTDGGANWTSLAGLDTLMTGGGAFRYQTNRGPINFTAFGSYPQPTLVAFDPEDRNLIVAGAADAGLFVSSDAGTNWMRVSDPFNPCCSGKPHIPRPWFAYFDHEPWSWFSYTANVYVGTQGRGVWRLTLSRRNLIAICKITNLCDSVILDRGSITLNLDIECITTPCRVFRDPIPKNCTIKFDCPGCSVGLCPPYYHLFLDNFDLSLWDVALFREDGELADYQLFRTGRSVVLSFRPQKEAFVEGRIGNYQLAFSAKRGAKRGRYVIRTRLEVGRGPFDKGERIPLFEQP